MTQLTLFNIRWTWRDDIALAWREINRLIDDVLNWVGEGEW